MGESTIDERIEAMELFIREKRDEMAFHSRKIADCKDQINWAKKAINTLKEGKEHELQGH